MSYYGNNKSGQECIMTRDDCNTIFENVNINLLSIVDIFYDDENSFKSGDSANKDSDCLYHSNNKAAETLTEAMWK